MKIAISGASGFVGSHLSEHLRAAGHDIVPLGRADLADGAQERLAGLIAACDAVVNLAGAPIDHRWTTSYKKELFASRIDTTRRLVDAVNLSPRTTTFISTSAVGLYPASGCHDEGSPEHGEGLLADLCTAWEAEAERVDARCVITRFGVVFASDGGAFPKLARPARMGVAVVSGAGKQTFAWIALHDLVRAHEFLLTHPELNGIFNFTAPVQTSLRELVRATAAHYRAHLTVHVPAFAVRLALGEAAAMVLGGQCVEPRRLLSAGFRFEIPDVAEFLRRL